MHMYFELQNLCFSPLFGRNTAVTMQDTVELKEFSFGYVKVEAMHNEKDTGNTPGCLS